MKNIPELSCVVVLGFAVTSCGSDAKTSATQPIPATSSPITTSTLAATTTSGGADSGAGQVRLVASGLGEILADKSGNTLYMFAKDTGATSLCTAACATKWPPRVGPVGAGVGLDAGDLATITRPDGTQQATFHGHPLYHFDGDTKPGNTNGQGVGGVWYVIDKEGKAIDGTTTGGPTTTATTPTTPTTPTTTSAAASPGY